MLYHNYLLRTHLCCRSFFMSYLFFYSFLNESSFPKGTTHHIFLYAILELFAITGNYANSFDPTIQGLMFNLAFTLCIMVNG